MCLTKKVAHPDFDCMVEKDIYGFPVCAFNRDVYIIPTEKQLEEHHRNRVIVEKLGGRMIKSSSECAGKHPPFTKQDCAEMVKAVLDTYPDFEVRDTWNGVGTYAFSVSIRSRAEKGTPG
jgi:hypothetical protein